MYKQFQFGEQSFCVSSNGIVTYNDRVKINTISHNGYKYVTFPFDKNGNLEYKENGTLYFKRRYYIHRLVAEAFVHNPNPVDNNIVLHINGDKNDNDMTNLKWVTKSDVSCKKYIYKYYIGGLYTGEMFESILSACNSVSSKVTGGISSSCSGYRKSWKGFEWSHFNPKHYIHQRPLIMNNAINSGIKRDSKTVYKYHIGGKYTGEFISSGSVSGAISSCAIGKLLSWKGFEWSYDPPELYESTREKRINKCMEYKKKRINKFMEYKKKRSFFV